MKKLVLIFSLIALGTSLFAKDSLILLSRDAGMFSIFMEVTSILNSYEHGVIKGVEVDFGKTGLYYDQNYGENWWQYYFEPIVLGDMNEPVRYTGMGNEALLDMSNPWTHHNMIQKYIRLKPHMQQKLDDFINRHFNGYYVIGVHYRGTDKKTESGRVTYEKMLDAIRYEVNAAKTKGKRWKIFLATDEEAFLNRVKDQYHRCVCYLDAFRAANEDSPVHTDVSRSPYRCGEEAVLDCILLSRSSFLLRTNSNLNTCSLFFDPSVESRWVQP